MSTIRKQVIESIRQILEEQKVDDYLVNPRIPEVLSNPNFLVVPRMGSLVTIAVQEIPAQKNWWSVTLALLEDLFEIKLSAGHQTFCTLVIISGENEFSEWDSNRDAFRLLQSFYDRVFIIPESMELVNSRLRQELHGLLEEPHANQNLDQFWLDEAVSRQSNYVRISGLPFVQEILDSVQSERHEGHPEFEPIRDKKAFIKQLALDIPRNTDLYVTQNVRALNIKEQFIGRSYYFPFDLLVLPRRRQHIENEILTSVDLSQIFEDNGSLFNVLFGERGNFRNREKLRKLATYSRLISYEIREGNLQPRSNPPNLFLLLVNDIWGPEYAPERYLQMLVSAGWKLIRPGDLTRENLLTR
jgi:hypothetical protein